MILSQLTVKEESDLAPGYLINIILQHGLDEQLTPAIPNNFISVYVNMNGGRLSDCSNSSSRERPLEGGATAVDIVSSTVPERSVEANAN